MKEIYLKCIVLKELFTVKEGCFYRVKAYVLFGLHVYDFQLYAWHLQYLRTEYLLHNMCLNMVMYLHLNVKKDIFLLEQKQQAVVQMKHLVNSIMLVYYVCKQFHNRFVFS